MQRGFRGGLLLGRKTYEGFAAARPKMTDTGEFGEKMNGITLAPGS